MHYNPLPQVPQQIEKAGGHVPCALRPGFPCASVRLRVSRAGSAAHHHRGWTRNRDPQRERRADGESRGERGEEGRHECCDLHGQRRTGRGRGKQRLPPHPERDQRRGLWRHDHPRGHLRLHGAGGGHRVGSGQRRHRRQHGRLLRLRPSRTERHHAHRELARQRDDPGSGRPGRGQSRGLPVLRRRRQPELDRLHPAHPRLRPGHRHVLRRRRRGRLQRHHHSEQLHPPAGGPQRHRRAGGRQPEHRHSLRVRHESVDPQQHHPHQRRLPQRQRRRLLCHGSGDAVEHQRRRGVRRPAHLRQQHPRAERPGRRS